MAAETGDPSLYHGLAGVVLVAFTCLGLGVRRAMRAVCGWLADDLSLPADGYSWSDYYASADPVSNGPLPRSARRQAATDTSPLLPSPCEEVFNSASILFDHNGYLRNQDELLPRLVNDLVHAAHGRGQGDSGGRQLVHPDDIAASRHRRLRLVRCLIASRIVAGCLFVTLLWADPGPILRRPLDGLLRLLFSHAQMGDGTARLVASSIITAAFYALAVATWRFMLGRSVERFFKTATRDPEPSPSDTKFVPASRAPADVPTPGEVEMGTALG